MDKDFPFAEYLKLGEVKKLIHRFDDEITKRGSGSVAITSLEAGEGRTFLTALLALGTASFLGKKVLVIDTSFQPSKGNLVLERIFGKDSPDKYVDCIKAKGESKTAAHAADFELKGLLDHYKTLYDLVIFDTAAINESNSKSMDPIIVSKTAGGTIMILSSDTVTSGDFNRIRSELADWGIPIVGTVYNFWSGR